MSDGLLFLGTERQFYLNPTASLGHGHADVNPHSIINNLSLTLPITLVLTIRGYLSC